MLEFTYILTCVRFGMQGYRRHCLVFGATIQGGKQMHRSFKDTCFQVVFLIPCSANQEYPQNHNQLLNFHFLRDVGFHTSS